MAVKLKDSPWVVLCRYELFNLWRYLPHNPKVTIESEDYDIEVILSGDDLHRPLQLLNIPWNDHRSGLKFTYKLGEFIVCSLLLCLLFTLVVIQSAVLLK